jgi:hypothetical protein
VEADKNAYQVLLTWIPQDPQVSPIRAAECDTPGVQALRKRSGEQRSEQRSSNGRITGKGFQPGRSGNPGGRPQSLAKATRQIVGEDGMKLAELWWSIASDETRRDRDRLEASRLLAGRDWGKAPTFAALEEPDPLDLANPEQAAEEFRAAILRFAPSEPDTT